MVVSPPATAARSFIAIFTAVPDLPVLRSTASAHGVRRVSRDNIEGASISTVTVYFKVPTITPGLATATHYSYIGDADNYHGGVGERTSGTSVWDIRTRISGSSAWDIQMRTSGTCSSGTQTSAPCRPHGTSRGRKSISPIR